MRANLESELVWRQEELAFFKNQLNNFEDDESKDKYRKSMVLMLYSHLEGFMKISLHIYIQYINSLNLERNKVNANLVASSMHKELNAYDNLDRKCKFFKRELPEDKSLHHFYRRVDLLESIEEFKEKKIYIDDDTIDTESNLRYVILQKNLFKVGLPVDLFCEYASDIDALVNRRNSLAHGDRRAGVVQQEYENWENKVYRIFSEINRLLYDYAVNARYLVR